MHYADGTGDAPGADSDGPGDPDLDGAGDREGLGVMAGRGVGVGRVVAVGAGFSGEPTVRVTLSALVGTAVTQNGQRLIDTLPYVARAAVASSGVLPSTLALSAFASSGRCASAVAVMV